MAANIPPLIGDFVRLEPLGEQHKAGLRAACDADPEIWASHYPFPMNGAHLDDWWRDYERGSARRGYAAMRGGEVVGCSLYILDEANLRVEIGNTYWRPDLRGGALNPEAKYLMMAHAFAAEGGLYPQPANVVQYRVDATNARSRAAVLKLGAKLDGIIRADRITWTGRVRDTCVFSITRDEWPTVRDGLEGRLKAFASP